MPGSPEPLTVGVKRRCEGAADFEGTGSSGHHSPDAGCATFMLCLLGLDPEEKRTPLSSAKTQCPQLMVMSPSALPKRKGRPHRPMTSFLAISFLLRPIEHLGWILLVTTSWDLGSTNCKRMMMTLMLWEGIGGPSEPLHGQMAHLGEATLHLCASHPR